MTGIFRRAEQELEVCGFQVPKVSLLQLKHVLGARVAGVPVGALQPGARCFASRGILTHISWLQGWFLQLRLLQGHLEDDTWPDRCAEPVMLCSTLRD